MLTTYDPFKEPEKMQSFKEYTKNQLEELVRDYGKIDILWLDGAVEIPDGERDVMIGELINIGEIVDDLRKYNPELIAVDRLGVSEYENYLTPEMKIPDDVISVPWESCLTLGSNFHYVFDDEYKSPSELIGIILEIVCKGGNLALNVSQQPDGRMPRNAIKSLKGLGKWLKKYGEGIYKTRPCVPYKENNVFFTQTEKYIYAFVKDFAEYYIPCTQKISKIKFLNTGCVVDFETVEEGIKLKMTIKTDGEYSVFKLYKQM